MKVLSTIAKVAVVGLAAVGAFELYNDYLKNKDTAPAADFDKDETFSDVLKSAVQKQLDKIN